MANDINVQDMFLEKVRSEKLLVAIYFEKIKMLGLVKAFDQFSITLDSNGQEQMVYKQGINYISLQKPKRFFKPRPEGFRPREAREGDTSSQGQPPQDGSRRPFSPRPRFDSDHRGSDNRGDFRRPDDRRVDYQSGQRFDSQTPAPHKSDGDSSPRSSDSDQSTDDSKKVFRVQKPYPPKKS